MSENHENRNESDNDLRVRVPATLSLRDVVLIIGIVLSGALAWASVGARLSVVEDNVKEYREDVKDIKKDIKEIKKQLNQNKDVLKDQVHELDSRIRENESRIKNLEHK